MDIEVATDFLKIFQYIKPVKLASLETYVNAHVSV